MGGIGSQQEHNVSVNEEILSKRPHHRKPVIMTAEQLLSQKPAPMRWAVDRLLPDGLCLLAAKPKAGKSWLALGTVMGAGGLGQADDRPALYVGLEDTTRRLHGRTSKLLDGIPPPPGVEVSCEWPTGPDGLICLDEWLDTHPGTRLVVLDTLPIFLSGRSAGSDAYKADYDTHRPLKVLADKYGVCILGVVHQRKEGSSDPFSTLVGTTGVTGCADALMVLDRPRCGEDAVLHVTGRDVEEQRLALRWHSSECRWEVVGPAGREFTPEQREVMDVFSRLGPSGPAQVAKELGLNVDAVKKRLRRMAAAGILVGAGGDYRPAA